MKKINNQLNKIKIYFLICYIYLSENNYFITQILRIINEIPILGFDKIIFSVYLS
jgi:hypothetical protein